MAAHEVTGRTGFSVSYGTIRAADLPEYLDNGMVTTPAMRELTFSLYERLVLVPVEIVHARKSLILFGGIIYLAATLMGGSSAGFAALFAYLGAVLTGMAIAPILLPWIPGTEFCSQRGIGRGRMECYFLFSHRWQLESAGHRCRIPGATRNQRILHTQLHRLHELHLPLGSEEGDADRYSRHGRSAFRQRHSAGGGNVPLMESLDEKYSDILKTSQPWSWIRPRAPAAAGARRYAHTRCSRLRRNVLLLRTSTPAWSAAPARRTARQRQSGSMPGSAAPPVSSMNGCGSGASGVPAENAAPEFICECHPLIRG